VIVCQFHHVHIPMFESSASHAIDTLGVLHVSINKTNRIGKKTVCEKKRNCAVCNTFITENRHECFKPFCTICQQNREIGHLCFMQPLKNE
jgi:hypothetical protein